jgi:serine/threonine protein kinase
VLTVTWGEFETFNVGISSFNLLVSEDGGSLEQIPVSTLGFSHELVVKGKDKVCVRLVATTRGGESTSTERCESLKEGLPLMIVIAVVVSFVVLVGLMGLYFTVRRKGDLINIKRMASSFSKMEHRLSATEKKKQEVERLNVELHENLKMLQKYTQAEKDMIDGQIATFRRDFQKKSSVRNGKLGDEAEESNALERLLISSRELESEEVVGKGSFGEVHKSKYRGAYVAVKTLHEVDKESLERFQGEILLMADLIHTNIVRLVGACWEKDLMALVMEFAEKGMSSSLLRAEGGHFSWDDPLLKWCMDTARAMRYLHGVSYNDIKTDAVVAGIIHRDLKPDNCLVSETYTIKVADFGEARAFNQDNTMTQVGTPLFIAPEIVKGDHYSTKADVFSYALTVLSWGLQGASIVNFLYYHLMSKGSNSPSEATMAKPSLGRLSHAMINMGWRPPSKVVKGQSIPPVMVGLLELCWLDDPEERPTFKDIMEYLENDATLDIMHTTQRAKGDDTARRASVSGALKAKILAHEMERGKEGAGRDKRAKVDATFRNLVELLDENEVEGSSFGKEELGFVRTVMESVVRGRWGRGGGVEGYLEGLSEDELKKRIEEDEKTEGELKRRLQEREEKRKAIEGSLPGSV